MSEIRCFGVILLISMGVFEAHTAHAQGYPNKSIRLVTSPAGGGGDFLSRLVAQGITGPLGQPVVIDNRPPSLIGETVASAAPDGYTMLFLGNILWFEPLLRKTSYDPLRDLAPIAIVGVTPQVLVVHPSLPVKSVKELVALAKSRPGELNYALTGIGSESHLAAELFKSMAGASIVGVPYKGASAALNALIGGEVQVLFTTAASAMPHVKTGRLRGLVVTSSEPSVLVAGMPTMAASGLPGYEMITIYAMLAPAKTPMTVIGRLNQEIVRAVNTPDIKAKFLNAGVEVTGSAPEELGNKIKSEMAKWDKVIKDAGIKTD